MTQDNIARLDGLVPDRLAPRSRKIVLDGYDVPVDIGFHDFEVGVPQRLIVTVEVWVDEHSFAASDERSHAWDYDFLRTEIGTSTPTASASGWSCRPSDQRRGTRLRAQRPRPSMITR